MIQFMYINPAMINPRTKENVREKEIAKILKWKEEGKKIIAMELNVKGLNEFCDLIIDPQHTDGNSDICCAKEVALHAKELLGEYVGKDVVIVSPRLDVDSIAAMLLAEKFLNGGSVECTPYIEEINAHDTYKKGKWEKPILTVSDIALLNNKNRNVEDEQYLREKLALIFNPNDKMKAMASSIKTFVDYSNEASMTNFMESRKNVRAFMASGQVDQKILDSYAATQNSNIDKIMSGEVKIEYQYGGVHIETKLLGMTDLVYAGAPAGTIYNPVMGKWTICQFEEGYLQVVSSQKSGKPTLKVAEELSQKEPGWGGSTTICGSPMGNASVLKPEEIKKEFFNCLTPEYKAKVTSRGVINAGKGMGE